MFLTANFYAYLGSRLAVDVTSEAFRARVSPLNTPVDPSLVSIVRDASTSSFHIAMVLGAVLLVLGGLVNAAGIVDMAIRKPAEAPEPAGAAEGTH